jgi:hypothetical protein
LEHDFLWRTTCDLPERGRIGIFQPILLRGSTHGPSAPRHYSRRRAPRCTPP